MSEDDNQLSQELTKCFPALDASLLKDCVTLCKNYALSAEELQFKWEAFNFRPSATRSEISPYTPESLDALKQAIQRERVASAQPKAPRNSALVAALNRSGFRGRGSAARGAAAAQVKIEPDAEGFAMVAGPSTVAFEGPDGSRKKRAYRYMLQKPSERGRVMDEHIDEFAEKIREVYGVEDIGDPSASTSDDITVVGRIIHDDDTAEDTSKLGENSIAIECSRNLASGARAPLRFDAQPKIRNGPKGSDAVTLFPGALVAMRGRNGGAGHFLVSEILLLPPPPPAEILKRNETQGPFTVFIASGPYSPDKDLGFKPWRTLLKKIQEAKPAVVVLIGPFIDAQHPLIKLGDVDSTPLKLFRTRFVDPLRSYLDSVPGSIAVLVPSPRDLISTHAVFPQAEFEKEVVGSDPRMRLVPNPAWFSLNGLTFSVTSVDTLFHVKRGEFSKKGEEADSVDVSADDGCGDAIVGLCKHIVQQRSVYPVFPVPSGLEAEVVLDVSHSDALRLGPASDGDSDAPPPECIPDVLIVPSRLKLFAKPIYNALAINPGFVARLGYVVLDVGSRAGTGRPTMTGNVMKVEI
ncbi:DNA polymerase alpha subunit B [Mycena kentingensis (nom. inval.)]|nr:DNA polymerase alpha subunit B [Mycena kentingensis (nom. inval.)]